MVFFHDYTSAWSSTTPPLDENLRLRSSLLIAPTASEPYTSAGPSVIAPPEENLRIYTQAGSSVIALPEENLRMGLPSSETLRSGAAIAHPDHHRCNQGALPNGSCPKVSEFLFDPAQAPR